MEFLKRKELKNKILGLKLKNLRKCALAKKLQSWMFWGSPTGTYICDNADIPRHGKGIRKVNMNELQEIDGIEWDVFKRILIVGNLTRHSNCFVATKVGNQRRDPFPARKNFDYDYMVMACESSLRRLRRKVIDLYQLHNPSMAVIKSNSVWKTLVDEMLKVEASCLPKF